MEKEIQEEELFIPKTKHKILKIFFAILLIGGLIAGGYFIYKEKFDNPNKTVINIIEDLEKEAKNSVDDKIYKVNGVLKIDANLSDELKPITDIINKLDLHFIIESGSNSKMVNATLNAKYKNEQVVDVNIFADDKNIYFLLEDIYDKYLQLSIDDMLKEQSVSISEIEVNEKSAEKITSSFLQAIKKELTTLEFKRTSTVIKIDDNDRNVYNNYVELKETDIKRILKNIINTLSNDTDFSNEFKKMAGEDISINDLKQIIDGTTISGTYRLNFYTNKSIINPQLVSIRFETVAKDDKTTINFDKINDNEFLVLFDTSGGTISSRIKKTNSVFNANVNVNVLGMTIKIDLSSNYEKIKEVTKPHVDDSKKIEDLTEEEGNKIIERLQENKGTASLIEDFSKLSKLQIQDQ